MKSVFDMIQILSAFLQHDQLSLPIPSALTGASLVGMKSVFDMIQILSAFLQQVFLVRLLQM